MFIVIQSSLPNCKSKRQKKKIYPEYCWKWTGSKHLTPYLAFCPQLNCYAAVSLHQWKAISCPFAVQIFLLPRMLAATDCHKCLRRNLLAINISDGGMMHNGLASRSPVLQLISICNTSQLAQDRDQLEAEITQHTVKGQQLTEMVGREWMLTVSLQSQHSD